MRVLEDVVMIKSYLPILQTGNWARCKRAYPQIYLEALIREHLSKFESSQESIDHLYGPDQGPIVV